MRTYSDKDLKKISNGVWVDGAGRMEDMAASYLEERNLLKKRLRDLRVLYNQIKEQLFTHTYLAPPKTISKLMEAKPGTFIQVDMKNVEERTAATFVIDGISAAHGSLMAIARADVAITIMIANSDDPNTHKFWVEVVKNYTGETSKHAFLTLRGALDFIHDFFGVIE